MLGSKISRNILPSLLNPSAERTELTRDEAVSIGGTVRCNTLTIESSISAVENLKKFDAGNVLV